MKRFFNRYCFNIWCKWCLTAFSILSAIALFLPNVPEDKQFIKFIVGGVLVFLLLLSYVAIFLYESKAKQIKLTINNTEVNILFGDIFAMEGKKVIAFNEYFDTQVDDVIIGKRTLNGQVLDKGLIDKEEFDKLVDGNDGLIKGKLNSERRLGKKQRYKLGQIQPYGDYFALSFTYFNEKNEAHLYSNEYSTCLMEMWRQLNTYYAQNEINIPLLGSGITRILDDAKVSNQELLETMLKTLEVSKMTFKSPSKINIVLYPGRDRKEISKYNLMRIKYIFKEMAY